MEDNWVLDELAHAGPEHLDEGFIEGYDRKQGHPDPSPDVAEFQRHGLDRQATVVDLAAGTGQFALAAAQVFGRVIAVDVSPAMVRRLRATLAPGDVVQAGFLSYEHAGRPAQTTPGRCAHLFNVHRGLISTLDWVTYYPGVP